ncbi:hypothetical protein [Clostridium sp.]
MFRDIKRKATKSYKEIFQAYINNKDDYEEIKITYGCIKEGYIDKIEKKTIDISVERARLERNINKGKVLSVPNYISFTLLAMTILINGSITASTQYKGGIHNYYIITAITIIFVILIFYVGFSISLDFAIEDKNVIVSKLCIRVLEDIEKGEHGNSREKENKNDSETITAKQKLHEYSKRHHDKKK